MLLLSLLLIAPQGLPPKVLQPARPLVTTRSDTRKLELERAIRRLDEVPTRRLQSAGPHGL
jgi:hypothetical protein